MRTRVFKSGNSQAVRRASFDGLDRVLAAFPAAFMADRPLSRDQAARPWHDESVEPR